MPSITRNITQVKVQLQGCFIVTLWQGTALEHLSSNSALTPAQHPGAPQGEAVTLIIVPRKSCSSFPHAMGIQLCSEEEALPGPSPAGELLCPARWNTRHKARRSRGMQESSNQYSAQIPAPQHCHYLVWHMHCSHGNQHPSSCSILWAVGGSQNLWCPSQGSELLCANQPQEQTQEAKKKTQQSLVFLIYQQRGKQEVAWEIEFQQLREGTLM